MALNLPLKLTTRVRFGRLRLSAPPRASTSSRLRFAAPSPSPSATAGSSSSANRVHVHLRRRPNRQGTIYVIVLGAALIISSIALASLHMARVEVDGITNADRIARAELMAQSAIEFAMANLKSNASWRTTYIDNQQNPAATWYSPNSSDGFKFILHDNDGNLADDIRDNVTLTGLGRSGDATAAISVRLEPTGQALTCFNSAMTVNGNFGVSSDLTISQMVSSNQAINLNAGINGDAWSTGSISGGGVSGTKRENQSPPRTVPDATNTLEYYLANGTAIDINSIPSQTISKQVLSAGYNPYGAANSLGIYVIDCKSQQLTINRSRLECTLVITGVSAALPVKISNTIHWDPPFRNFPALIVQGNCDMSWRGEQQLDENADNANYNPPAAPYKGFSDSDQTDKYTGQIKGLVYVSGDLTISKQASFDGIVIVGGSTSITDKVTVSYNTTTRDYTPPGFSEGATMRILPQTWRRVAAP
jgi:hypothetical protein